MEGNQTNITNSIISTINSIFETLFSSLDNSIYETLDDLAFIDTNILNNSTFEKIFGVNSSNGILLIANSLLIAFVIYYGIKLLYSYYMNIQIERPYQFVFKTLIFAIALNCSYFICSQFLNINSLLSSSIRSIGENILNTNISFSELINRLNSIISIESSSFNIFSFDGLIKSFISIGLFNLIFSYALRYILLKVFILITPFAILTLINNSTSWFFKSWFKCFLSLLLIQSFVSIILLIIFSLDYNSSNILSKLMYVGGMYALIRANSYIRQLIRRTFYRYIY